MRGFFICLDEDLLVTSLKKQMPLQVDTLIGIGNSGLRYANSLALPNQKVLPLPIMQRMPSNKRDKMIVSANPIEIESKASILVDDVLVSGRTASVSVKATEGCNGELMVGCLFDGDENINKLSQMGVRGLYAALVYRSQYLKMKVPMNTLDTLLSYPERLQTLNDKYFKCPTRILRACFKDLKETLK